jgi:hypothetical protein
MSKLANFRSQLELHRKPKSDDPYDDRTNHCYLRYNHEGKDHCFQVRGWGKIKNNELAISVVNWTLTAGPASLHVKEETVDNYKIEKEHI